MGRLTVAVGESLPLSLRHAEILTLLAYRLADGIRVDFRELEALLAADRIHAALDLYRGPLLPGSDVPLTAAASSASA
jgi:hypothetical protein